jgi:hypothetical protein
MSRPIEEDSYARAIGRGAWETSGLMRRTPTAEYHIKIAADDQDVSDLPVFIFEATSGGRLWRARAFVTTVGSSILEVSVANLNGSVVMLSTNITIDSGEFSSLTAATPAVLAAEPDNEVIDGDQVQVSVVADGGGALGLGVVLIFV